MKTIHKMYEGRTFDSLRTGIAFKSMKGSFVVFIKVNPSMNPRQHNAESINTSQTMYDWFDQEETVHVQ